MKSLKGHFLVASPHLSDTNFFRSVVLMIEHDENGAFGLVMNRPTNNSIADVPELADVAECDLTTPIHLGGPVGGPLVAVHAMKEWAELPVVRGVYFAASQEAIEHIVGQTETPFRLFHGYSGWGPMQLDGELEAGGWLTEPACQDDVFSSYEDLWNRVARRIGFEILSPTIRRERIPDDPSMN